MERRLAAILAADMVGNASKTGANTGSHVLSGRSGASCGKIMGYDL